VRKRETESIPLEIGPLSSPPHPGLSGPYVSSGPAVESRSGSGGGQSEGVVCGPQSDVSLS